MTVNGKPVTGEIDPRTLLVQFLREHLRLTGTHVGCDTSQCGACVVHVNGMAIKSCTALALALEGADVLTIEGLAAPDGPLHPMQEAFRENHGLQCGYCTPGMIMTAVDIVRRKGNELDDRTIREELEGNICRCTGYHNIVKAIAAGARAMKGSGDRRTRRPNNKKSSLGSATGRQGHECCVMSATGIGAAVRRKEDRRFITGTGHYTDDINRPGQAFAYFVRSPHAHATIKSIDVKAASAMPGVLAVLTGAQLAGDKIGDLICGWMIHSKDGSPMKMAAHPVLANGKACHVGDAVAVVIGETLAQARDAAEKVKVDYAVLPAVADPAAAQKQGAPLIHDIAPNNTIYQWNLGDAKAVDAAFKSAKHVTKLDIVNNRLVPNAIEPRAAIGEYDSGTGTFTLWNTTQNPHVARLVIAAFVGMAPEHKLRVIAPDVGGGFGSKIFIYPEEVVALWASKRVGRPVKWVRRPLGSVPCRCAWPRSRHPCRNGVRRRRQDSGACAPRPIANLGAYMSTFSSSVPTYLYATLLSGQYEHSAASIARSTRSIPTPCRSMPIAAPAGRKRPSWSSGWSKSAPAKWARTPPNCGARISSTNSRTRRRSS